MLLGLCGMYMYADDFQSEIGPPDWQLTFQAVRLVYAIGTCCCPNLGLDESGISSKHNKHSGFFK